MADWYLVPYYKGLGKAYRAVDLPIPAIEAFKTAIRLDEANCGAGSIYDLVELYKEQNMQGELRKLGRFDPQRQRPNRSSDEEAKEFARSVGKKRQHCIDD